jgi:hypothetical protein
MGRHRNSFGSDNGTPPDSPHTLQPHSTPYGPSGTKGHDYYKKKA